MTAVIHHLVVKSDQLFHWYNLETVSLDGFTRKSVVFLKCILIPWIGNKIQTIRLSSLFEKINIFLMVGKESLCRMCKGWTGSVLVSTGKDSC